MLSIDMWCNEKEMLIKYVKICSRVSMDISWNESDYCNY